MNKYANIYIDAFSKKAGLGLLLKYAPRAIKAIVKEQVKNPGGTGVKNLMNDLSGAIKKDENFAKDFEKITSYKIVDPKNKNKNTGYGAMLGVAPGATIGGATEIPQLFEDTKQTEVEKKLFGNRDWIPDFLNPSHKETITESRSIGDRLSRLAKGTGKGIAAGGVGGAALGRYAPRVGQIAIGRLVSNTINPVAYNGKNILNEIFGQNLSKTDQAKRILSAVFLDKDHYDYSRFGVDQIETRRALLREGFGLKQRANAEGHVPLTRKADGTFEYNDAHSASKSDHIKTDDAIRTALKQDDLSSRINADGGLFVKSNRSAPGNFTYNTKKQTWSDDWDFNPNPGENVSDSGDPESIAMRRISNMIFNPPTIGGSYSIPTP